MNLKQEIFLTILNEYTDWTRPFFHPISLFESLVDIFSDALVVAPITQIGLFHAKSTQRTYFYVFAHQTENGDYNPRLGCVHGQDLAYLFGAPLVAGHALGWFGHNYTRSEVTLSENFMKYIAYFARTGNPNNESDTKAVANRFDAITRWPHYDDTQQHYISFGKVFCLTILKLILIYLIVKNRNPNQCPGSLSSTQIVLLVSPAAATAQAR